MNSTAGYFCSGHCSAIVRTVDEGDHTILEVAGSTERKGDTNALMTYCKSSLKGTFIPSIGKRGIRKYS